MNVATALNRKYLLYTGVMLTSLCENNPCHIDIYILHSELTDTDIQRLTECVDKYDISIHPLYIEKDKFEGKMYTDKMWSIEAYYRLMLLDILPSNVKRMFYFDVDIIVNKSLIAVGAYSFPGDLVEGFVGDISGVCDHGNFLTCGVFFFSVCGSRSGSCAGGIGACGCVGGRGSVGGTASCECSSCHGGCKQ